MSGAYTHLRWSSVGPTLPSLLSCYGPLTLRSSGAIRFVGDFDRPNLLLSVELKADKV